MKTEWKQQFDPPNQVRDCIHRNHAKSCILCLHEREIHELKQQIPSQDAIRLIKGLMLTAMPSIRKADFNKPAWQELEALTASIK
jgi:hypothetical protein